MTVSISNFLNDKDSSISKFLNSGDEPISRFLNEPDERLKFKPAPQLPTTKEQREEGFAGGMEAAGKILQFPLRMVGTGTAAVRQLHKEPLEVPGAGRKAWEEAKRAFREESTPAKELLGKEYSEQHPFQSLAIDIPADILATWGILGASKGILGAIPKVEKAASTLVKEGMEGLKRTSTLTNLNARLIEKETAKKVGRVLSETEKKAIRLRIKSENEALKEYSKGQVVKLVDPKVVALKKGKVFNEISTVSEGLEDPFEKLFDVDKTGTFPKMYRSWLGANNAAGLEAKAIKGRLQNKYAEFYKPGSDVSAAFQRIAEGRMKPGDEVYNTPKARQFLKEVRSLYDMLHARQNQSLKLIGKKIGYIKNYTHHFQSLPAIEEAVGVRNLSNDLLGSAFYSPKNPFSPANLQRKGGPFTDDLIGGFDRYLDYSTRIIHTTKPGQTLIVNSKFLPPRAGQMVKDAVEYVFGKPVQGPVEDILGTSMKDLTLQGIPQIKQKISQSPYAWVNQIMNSRVVDVGQRNLNNVVSGNIPILLSQPYSIPAIMAETSVKDTGKALLQLVTDYDTVFSLAAKKSEAVKALLSKENKGLIRKFMEGDLGAPVSLITDKVNELMSLLAFQSGVNKAKREGIRDVFLFADKVANATNRIYQASQTPKLIRGHLGRAVLPLQRYNLGNSTLFLKRMTGSMSLKEKAEWFAKYYPSSVAFNLILGGFAKASGAKKYPFEFSDLIPFSGPIRYGVFPAARNVTNIASGIIEGAKSLTEESEKDKRKQRQNFTKAIRKGALMFIPKGGGLQIERFIEQAEDKREKAKTQRQKEEETLGVFGLP